MKIENVILNKNEYTLVDWYEWDKNEVIYHLAGDEDDLFCKKYEGKFIIIQNKNDVKNIMRYYVLEKPKFYFASIFPVQVLRLLGISKLKKLDSEQRNQIINETTQQLTQLEPNITKECLEKRLKKVKICTGKFREGSLTGAFYHPATEAIVLSNDRNLGNVGKRTRLHEIIHAISGKFAAFISIIPNYTGLIEGATENIVEKIYGDKTSSSELMAGRGAIEYNFSSVAVYPEQVLLIRQMEYALQSECNESILMGNMGFFKEFAKEYGKDSLRFVRHRANRLLHPEKLKNEVEYLKETQDTLLEIIFEKDFEKVENLESATAYLKKLQGFEVVRARIYERKEGKIVEDHTFENFYKSKLKEIEIRLQEKGISENEIQTILSEYSYKRREFQPNETEQQQDARIQKRIVEDIVKDLDVSKESADKVGEYRAFVSKRKDGEEFILIRNGEPITMTFMNKYQFGKYTSSYDFKNRIPEGFSFAQADNLFYINTPQGREILLDELELIPITPQIQEKMKKEQPNEEKKTTLEQMKQLREIASKQCLSTFNRMIGKLRGIKENILGKSEMEKEGEDEEIGGK